MMRSFPAAVSCLVNEKIEDRRKVGCKMGDELVVFEGQQP